MSHQYVIIRHSLSYLRDDSAREKMLHESLRVLGGETLFRVPPSVMMTSRECENSLGQESASTAPQAAHRESPPSRLQSANTDDEQCVALLKSLSSWPHSLFEFLRWRFVLVLLTKTCNV